MLHGACHARRGRSRELHATWSASPRVTAIYFVNNIMQAGRESWIRRTSRGGVSARTSPPEYRPPSPGAPPKFPKSSRISSPAAKNISNFSHRLWSDDANRQLFAAHVPELLSLYDGYTNAVERADVARLLYMHVFGGIYADIDLERCGDGRRLGAARRRSSRASPASLVLLRGPTRFVRQRRAAAGFGSTSRRRAGVFGALRSACSVGSRDLDVLKYTDGMRFFTTAWEASRCAPRACERERARAPSSSSTSTSWIGAHRFAALVARSSWRATLGRRLDFMKPNGLRWLGVDEALNCVAADSARAGRLHRTRRGSAWIHVGKSGAAVAAPRSHAAGQARRPRGHAHPNPTTCAAAGIGRFATRRRTRRCATFRSRVHTAAAATAPRWRHCSGGCRSCSGCATTASRAVSCWNFFFFDGASDTAARRDKTPRHRKMRSAAARSRRRRRRLRATASIANATDLDAVLSALFARAARRGRRAPRARRRCSRRYIRSALVFKVHGRRFGDAGARRAPPLCRTAGGDGGRLGAPPRHPARGGGWRAPRVARRPAATRKVHGTLSRRPIDVLRAFSPRTEQIGGGCARASLGVEAGYCAAVEARASTSFEAQIGCLGCLGRSFAVAAALNDP